MTTHSPQSTAPDCNRDQFEVWHAQAIDRYGHLSPLIRPAAQPRQLVYALHRAYDTVDGKSGDVLKVSIARMYTHVRRAFNLSLGK